MPLDFKVTQFPDGLGTVSDDSVLNGVPQPLPNPGNVVVEDFTGITDWTSGISNVAITAPAVLSALASAAGVARYTTPGTAGQGSALECDAGANFVDAHLVSQGVVSFITCLIAISDPVVNAFQVGFIPGASGGAPADGLYLDCAAASGDVNLIIENSGGAQESVLVGTLEATDTGFLEWAIYWDGEKASAQIPGGGATLTPDSANIPSVGLNATLSLVEGAGGAATYDVDYLAFGGGRS